MQSANVPRILQDVNLHCSEQPQSASTDWDSSLHESVNPISNFQEKEMECIYYAYNGVLNGLPVQEPSWVATPSFQNACISQDQEGKRKFQQEIEHQQHLVVSADESQCAQFGCSNVSTCQEIGSYYSLYFHDKSDADVMKQQQNGTFINEYDLAKLSDLGPDIISLEGSVGSDLLKVVDSEEEEEDLVVDDSETESEISISDTSPCPIQPHNQSERHCMVCGLSRSHTVDANFLHVDSAFPLTFVSKTPVIIKLMEIIPSDMHPRLNFGHSLICRRCFNLIDTAENLELRLITVKQELCDFVARTEASKQSSLVEISRPNTSACVQYNGLEIPTYSAALMAAKPQTLQMTEFQQHITAKCGLSENIYLARRASSYFFNNTFTDKRLSGVENNAQSQVISKSSSSQGLLCNCRLSNNTKCSQFREALSVEECQCSQTSHSSINNLEKSEPKFKISQEESHKTEPTKKKVADEDITTKEVVTTNKEDSEKTHRKGFKSRRDSFQCDRCGRTYCQKFKLTNHLKKHYGDFRFRCEHCSKGYSTEWNLLLHLRCHKDVRPYLCNSCPASFLKAEQLKSHLLFCINKMYACNDCSKVFVSSQKLSEHTKSYHNKSVDDSKIKKLECKFCLKRFRYPTDLINHTSSHKDDKSHRCNICGRSYKHKRHLNRHRRVSHLNLIEENIEHGSKIDLMVNNVNSENFEQHSYKQRIVGLNEKPESELKTSENKRICPVCNKAVRKLKTHLISHSNVKGYRCGLCNVEFTLKQGLDRHMRNKHSTTESLNPGKKTS